MTCSVGSLARFVSANNQRGTPMKKPGIPGFFSIDKPLSSARVGRGERRLTQRSGIEHKTHHSGTSAIRNA